MLHSRASIQQSFFRYNITFVIVVIILWSLIRVQGEYSGYNKDIESVRTDYINEQKKSLQREVNNAIGYFVQIKKQIEEETVEEQKSEEQLLTYLAALRFGQNNYFFGSTTDGAPLFSNGEVTIGTGSILSLEDMNGVRIIETLIRAVKNPEGGFVNYLWHKIDNPLPVDKLSYVKKIPDTDWFIGAGVYMDGIEEVVKRRNAKLYAGLKQRIYRSVFVLFILIFLVFLWSKRISSQIHKTIETFLEFLRKASTDSVTINPEAFQFEEFRAVAESTNKMLQKRQVAEKALYESEQTFRNIFQNAQVGLFRMRLRDGKILESNSQLAKMFGFKDRESFIEEYSIIKSYLSAEKLKNFQERLEQNGEIENVEIELFKIDGVPFWVRYSARYFEERGYLEGVAEDITEQKKTEVALKESETKYRLLADNATDNIWILRLSDMKLIYSSPSIERMLGYSPEEFIMMELEEYIAGESLEKVNKTISAELNRQITTSCDLSIGVVLQIELVKKDNSPLWVEVKGSFLRDEKGAIDRILGITRDISERKNVEEEKILAQKTAAEHEKLALVGQIAGKMSHDFNNVLGVIMGNAEIALLDCREEETRKTLELIFDQTKKGKDLTKNLVAFAKAQEPRHEFFKINEKIDFVINLLKKDLLDIGLFTSYGENLPELLADSGMIEHAIVNIIQNAIHATSLEGDPVIQIRTFKIEDNIVIEIEDNGCGIPAKYHQAVYDPSFTLKGSKDLAGAYKRDVKGTGYGMANVKKYIGQHGGKIDFSSEEGGGTTFTISLPVLKGAPVNDEKTVLTKTDLHSGKKILLVEDEKSISGVQKMLLTEEPYCHIVDLAENGESAISLFEINDYDLISLDYILPGELNGMDVYSHIRQSGNSVPVLFISGNIEFLESIQEIRQQDNNLDHLSKPCQNADYLDRINSLLANFTSNI